MGSRSAPAMADLLQNHRNPSSSSGSSSDLSVRVERELGIGNSGSKETDAKESRDVANGGSVDNVSSTTSSSG